jgi:hypothetical protein
VEAVAALELLVQTLLEAVVVMVEMEQLLRLLDLH